MCGHKGILHGGASASVLDQFFGLMMCLLDIRGFTGQLQLSYRKIILCPSTGTRERAFWALVLIKGTFLRSEGRKQYFKATIIDEVVRIHALCYRRTTCVWKPNACSFSRISPRFWTVHLTNCLSRLFVLPIGFISPLWNDLLSDRLHSRRSGSLLGDSPHAILEYWYTH